MESPKGITIDYQAVSLTAIQLMLIVTAAVRTEKVVSRCFTVYHDRHTLEPIVSLTKSCHHFMAMYAEARYTRGNNDEEMRAIGSLKKKKSDMKIMLWRGEKNRMLTKDIYQCE